MLAGEGVRYLGEPFIVRPPGFPVLLAPWVAAFGVDYLVLNTVVSAIGVLGVVAVFTFYRPRLGVAAALALAVAVWLQPAYRELSNQVMSDVPAVAALFAVLCMERWAGRRADWRADLALAVAIGLAAYLRSALVLLAPAIAASRLFAVWPWQPGFVAQARTALPKVALVVGLVVAIQLPWSLRNDALATESPAEHTALHSYAVAMWHVDMADPASARQDAAALWERVEKRTEQLVQGLNARLQRSRLGPLHPWIALLALGAGALQLVRRREPAEFFLAGSVLVVCIYFGFAMRLLLPIYLLLLGAVAQTAHDAIESFTSRRVAGLVVAACLAALALVDARWQPGWDQIAARQRESDAVALELATRFPAPARLAADFGPHLALRIGRDVYSLRWPVRRAGVDEGVAFIERHGIEGLVLDERVRTDRLLRAALEPRHGCARWGEEGRYCFVAIERGSERGS